MDSLTHSSRIVIVGGGTWGVSAALHLARRGFTSVTVLDAYSIPSPLSAGNDINKIITARKASFVDGAGDDEAYAAGRVVDAAMEGWLSDPVFKPFYHETGYVVAGTSPDVIAGLDARARAENDEAAKEPGSVPPFQRLKTPDDFGATMPTGVFTGTFPGWKGWFRRVGAGWAAARDALASATEEARRLGVEFITGEASGKVASLLFEDGDVKGAQSHDGTVWKADRTILCAGARCDKLLDFKSQLRPTAWTLAHVKLNSSEAEQFRNLPVLFNVELGFIIESNTQDHELKICDEHPGYCNWVRDADGKRKSVPFSRTEIPLESEQRIRRFLRETMPQLADRPFSFARICWCADSPNREFIIGPHPAHPSLLIAAGASGHGFSAIPAIGSFIADALEGKLDERMARSFRWRPETAVNRDWDDTQGRFGGPGKVMDFQQVKDWTQVGVKL